jgi:DNA-binding MarR family transcriptional regulator
MGWVDAVYEANDRRTKYIMPTAKGQDYAKNLGEAGTLVFQSS